MLRNITFLLIIGLMAGCVRDSKKPPIGQPYTEIEGTTQKGTERKYNEKGQLISETTIENSKYNGYKKIFYANGNLFMYTPVTNNKSHGLAKEYYPTGSILREIPYDNGRVHGTIKKYHENGALMSEAPFSMGKALPGLVEYDRNGKIVKQPELLIAVSKDYKEKGKYNVELSLSNRSGKVKYYNLVTSNYGVQAVEIANENGKGFYSFFAPSGTQRTITLNFEAKYSTPFNNLCVIRKERKVAIDEP
jgi:hypothetical protein